MQKTPFAALARPVAGTVKNALVVTLPGSVKAVKENLEALLQSGVVEHAIDLVRGGTGKQVHAALANAPAQSTSTPAHEHHHHHPVAHPSLEPDESGFLALEMATPSNMVKSELVYMNDGNIILRGNATEPGLPTIFRVHKSILTRHSATFSEMFMLPPLTEGPERRIVEMYDGVPEVQMQDSADDLCSFLHVLYDPTCVLHPAPTFAPVTSPSSSVPEERPTDGSRRTPQSSCTAP